MSLKKNKTAILNDFSFLENWEEKYKYLIDLGKSLPHLDKAYKVDENLIYGCQAQVWFYLIFKKNKLIIHGDSDAIITKGLVGLLVMLFSNCSAEEIVNSDTKIFKELGLNKHLSITRANGLSEMLKKIHNFCLNYLKNQN